MARQDDAAQCGGARILIGRAPDDARKSEFGFGRFRHPPPRDAEASEIYDEGEGHILAIAPTGAGKGRNLVIPNLLTYQGPVIVVDPKGEAAQTTARRRREMGQDVVILHPFACDAAATGAFNPVGVLDPASDSFTSDCIGLAHTLTGGQRGEKDPFWDQQAEGLIAGLLAYIAEYQPPHARHLGTLRKMLCESDLSYNLAVLLDTVLAGKTGLAADELSNFLGHEGDKVRTSVRSTAQAHTLIYAGANVQRALDRSTFDPDLVTSGAPLTIYLVVPPHLLHAYGPLLRIWIGTLMTLITRRTEAPPMPTLFVLDELAHLGAFPLLKPAVTLLRGYGVRCMLLLQSLAQLRDVFDGDQSTIVNNCATLLTFGHTDYAMSIELAGLLGDISPDTLFAMPRTAMALRRAGSHTQVIDRVDYLTDPVFADMFDANALARRRDPRTR